MLYGVVALLLLAADQGLKLWVSGNFELLESRPLIPGLVELKYVQNTGGGWSVLSDHTWLLSLFTALIIAAVAVGAITVDIVDLYGSVSTSLRHAFFQVSSIMTTTGYATVDFNTWPSFSKPPPIPWPISWVSMAISSFSRPI